MALTTWRRRQFELCLVLALLVSPRALQAQVTGPVQGTFRCWSLDDGFCTDGSLDRTFDRPGGSASYGSVSDVKLAVRGLPLTFTGTSAFGYVVTPDSPISISIIQSAKVTLTPDENNTERDFYFSFQVFDGTNRIYCNPNEKFTLRTGTTTSVSSPEKRCEIGVAYKSPQDVMFVDVGAGTSLTSYYPHVVAVYDISPPPCPTVRFGSLAATGSCVPPLVITPSVVMNTGKSDSNGIPLQKDPVDIEIKASDLAAGDTIAVDDLPIVPGSPVLVDSTSVRAKLTGFRGTAIPVRVTSSSGTRTVRSRSERELSMSPRSRCGRSR
jgi:hypothetical protein